LAVGTDAGTLLRTILGVWLACCADALVVKEIEERLRTIRVRTKKTPRMRAKAPERRKVFSRK
jgi:hypothetical protein